jgi:hypothetical protein
MDLLGCVVVSLSYPCIVLHSKLKIRSRVKKITVFVIYIEGLVTQIFSCPFIV